MTAKNPAHEAFEELATHIRQTLPQPRAITKLEIKPELDSVQFHWNGREFLVRKNMDVLELRGDYVYVTGTSILIHSVLTKKSKNERVLGAIQEVIKEAEDLIGTKYKADAGLKLLGTAKASLMKLAGIKRPHHSSPLEQISLKPA